VTLWLLQVGAGAGTWNPFVGIYEMIFGSSTERREFIESQEVKAQADAAEEEELEAQVEQRIENLKAQRAEIMEKIVNANFKLMKFKRQVKSKQRTKNEKKANDLAAEVSDWQQQLRSVRSSSTRSVTAHRHCCVP
jgi:F0F1-type ATP synthase membrane subunit b/b'